MFKLSLIQCGSGEDEGKIATECTDNDFITWDNFQDPSAKKETDPDCHKNGSGPCKYKIQIPEGGDSFYICFWLEGDYENASQGLNEMTKDGINKGICSISD